MASVLESASVIYSDLRTPDVLAMIVRVRQDWGACPILADALQDAGCDNADILSELRSTSPRRHVVGEFLVGVLGASVVRVIDEDARPQNSRRTARTADAEGYAARTAARAITTTTGKSWGVIHGGDVANNYGYAAITDGVLAAAIYDAATNTVRVALWADTLPANKVTTAGVAGRFGYRDLCDGRVSGSRQRAAFDALFADLMAG